MSIMDILFDIFSTVGYIFLGIIGLILLYFSLHKFDTFNLIITFTHGKQYLKGKVTYVVYVTVF